MRILGISNPTFVGVTVATKAVTTDYYPLLPLDNPAKAPNIANAIARWKPDVLVIGGWSAGYRSIVEELRRIRTFPILSIYHSTLFHGRFFGDEKYIPEIEKLLHTGLIDYMAYVHPDQVRFEQVVKKRLRLWVPHSFKMERQITPPKEFTIGILGGTGSLLKNSEGAIAVAQEYALHHPKTQVLFNQTYDKGHKNFLSVLANCSVIIHPSHLECYSNLMQEAWSLGVPVIYSRANLGLSKSPLLQPHEQKILSSLCLDSATDPHEVYQKLIFVRETWQARSNEVYSTYKELTSRTEQYLTDLMIEIRNCYQQKSRTAPIFQMFFAGDSIESLKQ